MPLPTVPLPCFPVTVETPNVWKMMLLQQCAMPMLPCGGEQPSCAVSQCTGEVRTSGAPQQGGGGPTSSSRSGRRMRNAMRFLTAVCILRGMPYFIASSRTRCCRTLSVRLAVLKPARMMCRERARSFGASRGHSRA